MEGMLKVALAGVTGGLLCLILKKDTPALALAVTVAVVGLLSYWLLDAVEQVIGFMRNLSGLAGLEGGLFLPVIKCVGIAMVTRIAADLCRDARETAIASAVELAGTVISLFLTLPLFSALIKLVTSLI